MALYGTGATADDIQRGYDNNLPYQLKRNEQGEKALNALRDNFDEASKDFFGRSKYYGDFLRFYQGEMEAHGWQSTVLRYLLGNEQNFRRLFAGKGIPSPHVVLFRRLPCRFFPLIQQTGLLHPYLQLMYGLEWAQPVLVAQGLAQASVHKEPYGALFAAVDEKARLDPPAAAPRRHLADLFDTIGAEYPHLVAEPRWEDGDGSQAAILKRIPDQIADYLAANVAVGPDGFDEQVDAMVHASAYFAAASIFHPPHKPKFDFFIMQVVSSLRLSLILLPYALPFLFSR